MILKIELHITCILSQLRVDQRNNQGLVQIHSPPINSSLKVAWKYSVTTVYPSDKANDGCFVISYNNNNWKHEMTTHPCFEILQCSIHPWLHCTHSLFSLCIFGNIVHRAMRFHKMYCNACFSMNLVFVLTTMFCVVVLKRRTSSILVSATSTHSRKRPSISWKGMWLLVLNLLSTWTMDYVMASPQ